MEKNNEKIIISIEGNIGVGKTTFIDIISFNIDDVFIVKEPIDEWIQLTDFDGTNLLETYYNSNNRWAYSFQNMACLTKMEKLLETLKNPNISSKYIFLDRSIETDLNVFSCMYIDNKTYSALEYSMFKKFYQIYQNYLKPPNKQFYIYLKCSPEKSLERIKKRNRPEEANITLEYLQIIADYHNKWLDNKDKPNNDVIIFDCENDFKTNPEIIKQMIDAIKMKINV